MKLRTPLLALALAAAAALTLSLAGPAPLASAYSDSVSRNYGPTAEILNGDGTTYVHTNYDLTGRVYYGGAYVRVPANKLYCRVVNSQWKAWPKSSVQQYILIPHGTHNYKVRTGSAC